MKECSRAGARRWGGPQRPKKELLVALQRVHRPQKDRLLRLEFKEVWDDRRCIPRGVANVRDSGQPPLHTPNRDYRRTLCARSCGAVLPLQPNLVVSQAKKLGRLLVRDRRGLAS